MRFQLARRLAVAAFLCAPAAAAVHGVSIHRRMMDLERHFKAVEAGLPAGPAGLEGEARAIAGICRELAPERGDGPWRTFLKDTEAAAGRLEAALAATDEAAARAALKEIAALRDAAHDHYRPGLLKRLKRWFKKDKRDTQENTKR